MSTGPDSQQLVQSLVQGFVAANHIYFAILAVLLHDMVAYFEEEVKYFWAKPKSAVSILYFVNRYGAILTTVSELILNSFNANEAMCRVSYVLGILYILFMRVRALYSQGRMITMVLFSIFCLDALAGMSFTIHGSILQDPSVFKIDGLSVCVRNVESSAELLSSWCIPLAYSTLLMVLALYKARQIWKESAGLKGSNLVKVLIRDQVFYFLAVNVVCIAEILGDTVEPNSFGDYVLSAVGNPCMMSIVGSRLLFNMKEAGEKGLNQGLSYSLKSVKSNIEFAVPPDGVAESSFGNLTGSLESEIQDNA